MERQNRTADCERGMALAVSGRRNVPSASIVLIGVVLAALTSGLDAAPPLVLKAVPADAVAVYVAAGQKACAPPHEGPSAVQMVASLSDQAYQLGVLSKLAPSVRGWIDALSSLPEILPYPHAVVLLDITGRRREDGGHELAELEAVLIVATRGANQGLERRIQHLLNVYTNTAQTTLSSWSHEGDAAFTIKDRRLPPWATISWGQLGDHYVVTLGAGAYERVADTVAGRSPSLQSDTWVAQGIADTNASDAALLCYVDLAGLRRNADASLASKIGEVAEALTLHDAERALVALAHADRSVEAIGVLHRGGRDEIVPLVGRRFLADFGEWIIPQQARSYAAIDLNPRGLVRSIAQGYLAAKSPSSRERVRSFWREVESGTGVSIERDILQHLGRPMIIHDYPHHALNLPLAWTILLPVQGDANVLRENLNKLLGAARRELAGQSRVQLVRDPDGVWYVQFGLAGPAMVVTDEWVVISFSPHAVRQNIGNPR